MSANRNGTPKTRRENTIAGNPTARAFLAAVAEVGNITVAASLSGCARTQHYNWLKVVDGYREAFDEAMENAADLLEKEARRRAVEGVAEPVFHNGKAVGAVRKYSDTLLIFLLKGARPERYRERHHVAGEGVVTFAQALATLRKDRVANGN